MSEAWKGTENIMLDALYNSQKTDRNNTKKGSENKGITE